MAEQEPGIAAVRVPAWLDNLAAISWRVIVTLVFVVVLVAAVARLWVPVAVVLVAICVVAAVRPIVLGLRHRGWSRRAASVTAGALAIGLTVAVIIIGVLAIIPVVPEILAAVSAGIDELQSLIDTGSLPAEFGTFIEAIVASLQSWIVGSVAGVAGDVATAVTVLILSWFLTFYLLEDGEKGWQWSLRGMSTAQRVRLLEAGRSVMADLGSYLRWSVAVSTAMSVVAFASLTLAGTPLAGPLAMLVLLAGMVPYYGPVFAVGLVSILALVDQGPLPAVVVGVAVALSRVVTSRLIDLVSVSESGRGRRSIGPAIGLVAIPVAAAGIGLFGLFIAVPAVIILVGIGTALVTAIGEAHEDTGPATIVPLWLARCAAWSWRLLLAVALVAIPVGLAGLFPAIALPIILGAVLAATVLPAVRRLEITGLSRVAASLVVLVGLTAASAAILAITVAVLAAQAGPIVAQAIAGATEISEGVDGSLEALVQFVATIGTAILDLTTSVIGAIAAVVFGIALTLVLAFIMLRDAKGGLRSLVRPLSPWRQQELTRAATDSITVTGDYMSGTAVLAIFGGVTQWLIMVILGIPLALPLGILTFFGGFIPIVGSAITTGIAFLVAVAYGETSDIVIMFIYTIVFNIIQGNVLQPIVYGKAASLHPAVVLLAIPAGQAIAGVLGMFLIVPVLGIMAIAGNRILHTFDAMPRATTEADDPTPSAITPGPDPEPLPAT